MPRKGFIYRVAVCRNVGREEVEERERAGVHRAELIPGPRAFGGRSRQRSLKRRWNLQWGDPGGSLVKGSRIHHPKTCPFGFRIILS